MADGVMGDDGTVTYGRWVFRRTSGRWEFGDTPDAVAGWGPVTLVTAAILDHHHPQPATVTLDGNVWTKEEVYWRSRDLGITSHLDPLGAALERIWELESGGG